MSTYSILFVQSLEQSAASASQRGFADIPPIYILLFHIFTVNQTAGFGTESSHSCNTFVKARVADGRRAGNKNPASRRCGWSKRY
jgi:hypothetical protein